MMLPTDGSPVEMHGVIIEDGKVSPAYLCDTADAAEQLANDHRVHRGTSARTRKLVISIREAP